MSMICVCDAQVVRGGALIFAGKSVEGKDQDEHYIYSSRKDKAEGDVIKAE